MINSSQKNSVQQSVINDIKHYSQKSTLHDRLKVRTNYTREQAILYEKFKQIETEKLNNPINQLNSLVKTQILQQQQQLKPNSSLNYKNKLQKQQNRSKSVQQFYQEYEKQNNVNLAPETMQRYFEAQISKLRQQIEIYKNSGRNNDFLANEQQIVQLKSKLRDQIALNKKLLQDQCLKSDFFEKPLFEQKKPENAPARKFKSQTTFQSSQESLSPQMDANTSNSRKTLEQYQLHKEIFQQKLQNQSQQQILSNQTTLIDTLRFHQKDFYQSIADLKYQLKVEKQNNNKIQEQLNNRNDKIYELTRNLTINVTQSDEIFQQFFTKYKGKEADLIAENRQQQLVINQQQQIVAQLSEKLKLMHEQKFTEATTENSLETVGQKDFNFTQKPEYEHIVFNIAKNTSNLFKEDMMVKKEKKRHEMQWYEEQVNADTINQQQVKLDENQQVDQEPQKQLTVTSEQTVEKEIHDEEIEIQQEEKSVSQQHDSSDENEIDVLKKDSIDKQNMYDHIMQCNNNGSQQQQIENILNKNNCENNQLLEQIQENYTLSQHPTENIQLDNQVIPQLSNDVVLSNCLNEEQNVKSHDSHVSNELQDQNVELNDQSNTQQQEYQINNIQSMQNEDDEQDDFD